METLNVVLVQTISEIKGVVEVDLGVVDVGMMEVRVMIVEVVGDMVILNLILHWVSDPGKTLVTLQHHRWKMSQILQI